MGTTLVVIDAGSLDAMRKDEKVERAVAASMCAERELGDNMRTRNVGCLVMATSALVTEGDALLCSTTNRLRCFARGSFQTARWIILEV
ncbi:hypothetical protein NUW54_g3302 [Trametes sanguinea]|uniref:Uncharacterized protein n=1 Tax=Trametes sanguinea TaxID=158606 RepID=A0ACC1Q2T2_9APHY|nr:hypothetical protein NUW54_g3302 [Trametes sanguinea]